MEVGDTFESAEMSVLYWQTEIASSIMFFGWLQTKLKIFLNVNQKSATDSIVKVTEWVMGKFRYTIDIGNVCRLQPLTRSRVVTEEDNFGLKSVWSGARWTHGKRLMYGQILRLLIRWQPGYGCSWQTAQRHSNDSIAP